MATLKNSKVVRFALVGGFNTALDFGLLFLLSKVFGLPVSAANIISTTIAFLCSFALNKNFTFRTTDTSVKRELILFVVVTLFGLWVLQNLVIWAVSPLLASFGLQSNLVLLLAKLLATIVSLIWNFVLYDRVVFAHKKEGS